MGMNRDQSREITRERLADWAEDFAGSSATPTVLVGISHDPRTFGVAVVCTVTDLSHRQLAALLRHAAAMIESGRTGAGPAPAEGRRPS